jgi:hypothetical protein
VPAGALKPLKLDAGGECHVFRLLNERLVHRPFVFATFSWAHHIVRAAHVRACGLVQTTRRAAVAHSAAGAAAGPRSRACCRTRLWQRCARARWVHCAPRSHPTARCWLWAAATTCRTPCASTTWTPWKRRRRCRATAASSTRCRGAPTASGALAMLCM